VSKFQVQSASTGHQLDKNGFIPLYYQIQRALMEKIRSGELAEGDSLESEEELARIYQVSRMTARQALHGLKISGYAFSQKGRGTFVTHPKMEKNIMHLRGFTEDMKQRGMVPSSRLLEQTVINATEDLAEKLRVTPGDAVMLLRRLRLADGIPMALEESNIPLKFFPGLERVSFAKQSLYHVLRENYGVRVAWADEVIEALPATREESELLTIPKRASVLSISRIIMTTEETPIEVACSRYRGDRYRASIRVPTTTIE
jgi:GntR family transcriptional regulator